MSTIEDRYRTLGEPPPESLVLAHNHVRHSAETRQGERGFRAFWVPADDTKWELCNCGWRPRLGDHYRARGLS